MRVALSEMVVEGIKTNIPLHQSWAGRFVPARGTSTTPESGWQKATGRGFPRNARALPANACACCDVCCALSLTRRRCRSAGRRAVMPARCR
jgi:hypothetical protein